MAGTLDPPMVEGRPEPRFKDLWDTHYLLRTCEFDRTQVSRALAQNWHWDDQEGSGLPHPYRLWGDAPVQPGEQAVAWVQGIERFRGREAQLQLCPSHGEMLALLKEFADGVSDPTNEIWVPSAGWQKSTRREVSEHLHRALAPEVQQAAAAVAFRHGGRCGEAG